MPARLTGYVNADLRPGPASLRNWCNRPFRPADGERWLGDTAIRSGQVPDFAGPEPPVKIPRMQPRVAAT